MTTRVALLPANLDPSPPGSIDGYVVTGVPLCGPDTTAGALHDLLVGGDFESAADIAVCTYDDAFAHRLLGLIPLERALAAPHDALARDLMDPDPPVVTTGADHEEAVWTAAKHGESSLAVVTPRGVLLGLVPPARVLTAMLAEHDRDLARLGGFLASASSARHAMDEPITARLWHRLPWLLLGLVGAAAAAKLVQGFESDLASDVRLAFFIPGIVYLADAVGTQTEALSIRGLSVGVAIRRVFRLEALTGLLVGLLLAAVTLPAVWLTMGSAPLAFTVSLALVAACSVATVVAMTLPWLMSRLGHDPAFGSGPLATVVQDLLSLVIYFAIAGALMG
ncbi:magnesium transporter [Nocardioides sp.]|uniref:magnesium transporter n=1 Tax=Nocardioides sp. TaxID=35761 RepID=UPI00273577EE|nr:magnesium transporter [Nocardioides sp.]MDP3891632.1 magnesium transporter [Nocardioides sp.]